jgi:uncharacterized protein
MSAAQPKPVEPSMEEILASIRRIISDDQTGKTPDGAAAPAGAPVAADVAVRPLPVAGAAAQSPATVAKPVFHDDEDIMDLAPKPVVQRKPLEPHLIHDDPIPSDVVFDDPAPVAPPVEPSRQAAPAKSNQRDEFDAILAAAEFEPTPKRLPEMGNAADMDRLLSPSTDRVVSTAFSSLASTVFANNARTLESLVEDMMRPMIKNWLDDNLPNIVERLIKAEIERVARGGR